MKLACGIGCNRKSRAYYNHADGDNDRTLIGVPYRGLKIESTTHTRVNARARWHWKVV
jgi:hypothetical protein